jgi:hypothetical protein
MSDVPQTVDNGQGNFLVVKSTSGTDVKRKINDAVFKQDT